MINEFDTYNLQHKIRKFPCYICLVRPTCVDYVKCELVSKNRRYIHNTIKVNKCPDCGLRNISKLKMYKYKCLNCNHVFVEQIGKLMERVL